MPRLAAENDGEMQNYQVGGSNFTFTAARIGSLGATEYTLVTIAVDVTGSTAGFADELHKMLLTAIESCKKSPRSDNLLVRVVTFSTYIGGVNELHGFKPLSEIEPTDYQKFVPEGLTPLYDATFDAIGATVEYGGELMENDFLANGIVFVITDGYDNMSDATPREIREQIRRVKGEERLESLLTVLIGINAAQYRDYLETFRNDAGLDQYIDAGDATPGKLAKLATFVSQSVSSQSAALGTGGPSQTISATI
ncbi:MAG TPA: hypothetical protein VFH06_03245 [Candidatus Saccharimonadales bacterium]|nr:hypothetical protein [Candidatus Saccharimonadales bacterium]